MLSVTGDRHPSLENSEPRSERTWGNTAQGAHLLPGEPSPRAPRRRLPWGPVPARCTCTRLTEAHPPRPTRPPDAPHHTQGLLLTCPHTVFLAVSPWSPIQPKPWSLYLYLIFYEMNPNAPFQLCPGSPRDLPVCRCNLCVIYLATIQILSFLHQMKETLSIPRVWCEDGNEIHVKPWQCLSRAAQNSLLSGY